MSVVEWKKDKTVAVITMSHGENRHSPVFVEAILKSSTRSNGPVRDVRGHRRTIPRTGRREST